MLLERVEKKPLGLSEVCGIHCEKGGGSGWERVAFRLDRQTRKQYHKLLQCKHSGTLVWGAGLQIPSSFSECCVMYAVYGMGLSVLTVSEMMLLMICFLFQIFSQKYKYSHCSICINMYVVSKCALKSLNRVLPRYPFRMGRWTSLDPQNFCWLRGPGSLSGRNICSVLTQVWFINMQDKTDFSFQLHLWICIVLIIIMIFSFSSLSHPKNALDSHTETHICAW